MNRRRIVQIPGLAVAMVLFAGSFIFSYMLSTYTIVDERVYAKQTFEAYSVGKIPKIYPLLSILSVPFLAIFGVTKASFMLTPFLAGVSSIFLTYRFSVEIFRNERKAILAAWLMACNPLLIWLSARHMTETVFTCILILTMLLASKSSSSISLPLSTGLSSLLAYLSRYPGILLFPYISGLYIIQRKPLKVLLAFFLSIILLMAYWNANTLIFGEALTTESYSFSFLQVSWGSFIPEQNPKLLWNLLTKSTVAFAMFVGYSLPFFWQTRIRELPKRGKIVIPFILFYGLFNVGYYLVQSLGSGLATSADHLARWLMPITPLVLIFAGLPANRRWINLLSIFFCTVAGISLGLYISYYSSHFSMTPIVWDEFIRSLNTSVRK